MDPIKSETSFADTICLQSPLAQFSLPITCVEIPSLGSVRNSCSQQLEMNPRAKQAAVGSLRNQALNLDVALNKHIQKKIIRHTEISPRHRLSLGATGS